MRWSFFKNSALRRLGTTKRAARELTVAGRPVVSVSHPDGVTTTYEPVEASVDAGDHVSRGEVIGTVMTGHPGCPVPACLHWGARRGSGRAADYLDPLGLLGAVRVRLKPVD